MTVDQAVKKAVEDNRHICEICGEKIEPADLATFTSYNGPDDFQDEPVHQYCIDEREEQMYRIGEEGDCL